MASIKPPDIAKSLTLLAVAVEVQPHTSIRGQSSRNEEVEKLHSEVRGQRRLREDVAVYVLHAFFFSGGREGMIGNKWNFTGLFLCTSQGRLFWALSHQYASFRVWAGVAYHQKRGITATCAFDLVLFFFSLLLSWHLKPIGVRSRGIQARQQQQPQRRRCLFTIVNYFWMDIPPR